MQPEGEGIDGMLKSIRLEQTWISNQDLRDWIISKGIPEDTIPVGPHWRRMVKRNWPNAEAVVRNRQRGWLGILIPKEEETNG